MNRKNIGTSKVKLSEDIIDLCKDSSLPGGFYDLSYRAPNETVPKAKVIAIVDSKEAADELIRQLNDLIGTCNAGIEEYFKERNAAYKLVKYNIKKISTVTEVQLSSTPASNSSMIGKDDFYKLMKERMSSDLLGSIDKDEILDKIEELNRWNSEADDVEYRMRISTGNSYRVSYYDQESCSRLTTNVGDILILYGKGIELMQNTLARKKRKDNIDDNFLLVFTYRNTKLYDIRHAAA